MRTGGLARRGVSSSRHDRATELRMRRRGVTSGTFLCPVDAGRALAGGKSPSQPPGPGAGPARQDLRARASLQFTAPCFMHYDSAERVSLSRTLQHSLLLSHLLDRWADREQGSCGLAHQRSSRVRLVSQPEQCEKLRSGAEHPAELVLLCLILWRQLSLRIFSVSA